MVIPYLFYLIWWKTTCLPDENCSGIVEWTTTTTTTKKLPMKIGLAIHEPVFPRLKTTIDTIHCFSPKDVRLNGETWPHTHTQKRDDFICFATCYFIWKFIWISRLKSILLNDHFHCLSPYLYTIFHLIFLYISFIQFFFCSVLTSEPEIMLHSFPPPGCHPSTLSPSYEYWNWIFFSLIACVCV